MRIRERLTYANVVATVALIIAVGGGGAAYALGKNTVGSKQIVNGAVHARDLHTGAVRNAKIRDNAVTGAKIADGTVGPGDLAASARAGKVYGGEIDFDGEVLDNFGSVASVAVNNQLDYYLYTVTFARDISTCLVTANGADYPAAAWHDPQGPAGDVLVHLVDATNPDSYPIGKFTVMVTCQP